MRQLYDAANEGDWAEVRSRAEVWLESCPIDIDVRYLAALALEETQQLERSQVQTAWYTALIEGVLDSGDGTTPETAFVVVSVDEEYAVLRAIGLQVRSQALLDGGIDAVIAEDSQGNASTVHFFPESHWQRLERAFPDVE